MVVTDLEVTAAASDEEAVLARLLELYAHDLSAIADLRIGADGRYGYGPLPLYWTEAGRHPLLVRVGGDLAGFALVQKGSLVTGAPDVWDMAEFFVLRPYRRQGIGVRAAHEVWGRHPGRWEVRVMDRNTAALRFWEHAVGAFVGGEVEPVLTGVAGKRWHVFGFTSSALPN
jgi:predicted acetyltransferase